MSANLSRWDAPRSDFENHTSGMEEYDEMPIATVHVTNSLEKRQSCSAPVPDTFAERMGKEIRVYLPPVSEPPPELEGEACQSKLYWQVVTDEPGRWWMCEHALDMD